jgi:hypothetical protein
MSGLGPVLSEVGPVAFAPAFTTSPVATLVRPAGLPQVEHDHRVLAVLLYLDVRERGADTRI